MTQVGEGRGAGDGGESMAFGVPELGEILAERYQLEQHVNDDSSGRQVWYGVDVLLRRPVAVVMRYPGGEAAMRMLRSAVETSQIVHPNLVGVYDAIDEGVRAYVVREWVDGASLRDHIAAGPFDPERATSVAHAVAAAVTAVHSTGMTHGNVHPGTVLIGNDGRVVLSDARADGAAPGEEDVRGVGAVLYYALTGQWPHAEVAGPRSLPDAMRDPHGGLASPRQIRAGIPDYLDNLAMDLLDRQLAVPPAEVLAGEFARIDAQPEESFYPGSGSGYPGQQPVDQRYAGAGYAPAAHPPPDYQAPQYDPDPRYEAGPLRFAAERDGAPRPRSGRKIALGVGALLVIGVLGLITGINVLTGEEGGAGDDVPPGANASPGTPEPTGAASNPTPTPIELAADQVRIVDPPPGSRSELEGVELVVDGELSTGWSTESYTTASFGDLKAGMGILIDLGEPRRVASVTVELTASGATAELRTGDSDPGNTSEGDQAIVESYERVGEAFADHPGTTMVFSAFDAETTYQYLLVWITEMPPDPDSPDKFKIGVQRVSVEGY